MKKARTTTTTRATTPRIIKETRQLYTVRSLLTINGKAIMPKPIPETTMPVIRPRFCQNQRLTEAKAGEKEQLTPIPKNTPIYKISCQIELVVDIRMQARPKKIPQLRIINLGP